MEYRNIGTTGLAGSVLGFGCGSLLSRSTRKEALTALSAALDHGINVFDTAPAYGQGASESVVGEFMRHRRASVLLVTKFGISFNDNPLARTATIFKPLIRRMLRRSKSVKRAAASFIQSQSERFDYAPDRIIRSVEGSLKRLRTSSIDILLMHGPPMEVVRRGDVHEVVDRLRAEGKVRCFGIACGEASTGFEFLSTGPAGAKVIQAPYSVHHTESSSLMMAAREAGAGAIARAPFDHGRLFDSAGAVEEIARERQQTAADVALRFVLDTIPVDVVLVSSLNPAHLAANVRAASMPPLSKQEIQRLAAPRGVAR